MILSEPLDVPFLRDIPLLSPAICRAEYSIDKLLLLDRVKYIALPVLAAMAAICLKSYVLALTCTIGALLWPSLIMLDLYASEVALDKLAVKDYLETENPPSPCIGRLGSSVNAFNYLIAQTDNFYKNSSEGSSILSRIVDFETFKLLADNNFDFSRVDSRGEIYLSKLFDSPDRLEYLVQERKIFPVNFNNDQQMKLWVTLASCFSLKDYFASLLVEAGFDINIRCSLGLTPLLKVISDYRTDPRRDILHTGESVLEVNVKALLNNGADPRLTVMYEGREQNALELASPNPVVQAVIRERMENR